MLDLFHLSPGDTSDLQIFMPCDPSTGGQSGWTTWNKPRGKQFVSMMVIGGGASGATGFATTATGAAGGGGGGGSSGITFALYEASWLPDQLFLNVSGGGAAVASGNGNQGSFSNICLYKDITLGENCFLTSASIVAGSATAGTGAAAGTGGSAATITTVSLCALANLAISRFFIAGVAGTNGGSFNGGDGVAQSIGTAHMILGGTGGGGAKTATTGNGGLITGIASTIFPNNLVGGAGGATPGNGSDGFRFGKFPLWTGGLGGGSTVTSNVAGGKGGNGVFGSGGGGGGASDNGGAAGGGGAGGPGLIIMRSF